jgi:hypothetical protein
MTNTKQILILESPLTGRFYATRNYKIKNGYIECTGQKDDVTDQVENIIAKRSRITENTKTNQGE